jgi:hypothetical protein
MVSFCSCNKFGTNDHGNKQSEHITTLRMYCISSHNFLKTLSNHSRHVRMRKPNLFLFFLTTVSFFL